jgi:hypothetical protein
MSATTYDASDPMERLGGVLGRGRIYFYPIEIDFGTSYGTTRNPLDNISKFHSFLLPLASRMSRLSFGWKRLPDA